MKVTKYQHACFTVEQDNQILVVDPGGLSKDFRPLENIVAIVVTHEHGDHLDQGMLTDIHALNPGLVTLGPSAVIEKVTIGQAKAVAAGDYLTVGAFGLIFSGGIHALIHKSMQPVENLGVMINERLYYPGDSFSVPKQPVDTLAIPAAAPWMKISEAIDYLIAIHPRFAFPTHDALLSDVGKTITDQILQRVADENSIEYKRIDGTSLTF